MLFKDIAIIGVACKMPISENLTELRAHLIKGDDCIRKMPRTRRKLLGLDDEVEYIEMGYLDGIENFDNKFFNISNVEAKQMSPEQRLSLETCAKAILDAGYSLSDFKGKNCSVIVSSSENKYGELTEASSSGIGYTGNLASMLCGKISYYFDLHGASYMVDTGCSSSLVGLHHGCMEIICGQSEYALVGGVSINLQIPQKDNIEDQDLLGIGSSSGRCYSFDAKADGAGVGEGVGFVLLKDYEAAVKDNDNIYAVIKGGCINSDGVRCNSMTSPSVIGQEEALMEAWKFIDPKEITDIEAHGTGTPIGDPIEITSLSESLSKSGFPKDKKVSIGCIKSNFGHLVSAAGIAGIIKILLSYKYSERYPISNFESPNPLINFDNIPVKPVKEYEKIDEKAERLTGISSFSLNGTNAHMLLANYHSNDLNNDELDINNHILKISAKTKSAARNYLSEIKQKLIENDYKNINDVIFTLNTGRDDYDYRTAVIAKDKEELIKELDAIEIQEKRDDELKTVFLITKDDAIEYDTLENIINNYQILRKIGINSDLILVDKAGRSIVDMQKNEHSISQIFDNIQNQPIKNDFEKVEAKLNTLSNESDILLINFGTKRFSYLSDRIKEFMCRDNIQLCQCIGKWYSDGGSVNWKMLYENKVYKKTSVPSYSFDKLFHWMKISNNPQFNSEKEFKKILSTGDLKEEIRQIWMNVLEQKERIEDNNDFFDLGGNSLLIATLLNEINNYYSINLSADHVYNNSVFTDFCDTVAKMIQEKNM